MVFKVSPERLVILGKGLLNLSIFFMKIKQRSSKSPQKNNSCDIWQIANSVCVTGKFVNPSACDGLLKNFYFMASFYGWGPTA